MTGAKLAAEYRAALRATRAKDMAPLLAAGVGAATVAVLRPAMCRITVDGDIFQPDPAGGLAYILPLRVDDPIGPEAADPEVAIRAGAIVDLLAMHPRHPGRWALRRRQGYECARATKATNATKRALARSFCRFHRLCRDPTRSPSGRRDHPAGLMRASSAWPTRLIPGRRRGKCPRLASQLSRLRTTEHGCRTPAYSISQSMGSASYAMLTLSESMQRWKRRWRAAGTRNCHPHTAHMGQQQADRLGSQNRAPAITAVTKATKVWRLGPKLRENAPRSSSTTARSRWDGRRASPASNPIGRPATCRPNAGDSLSMMLGGSSIRRSAP
jgi:hypothetical protein